MPTSQKAKAIALRLASSGSAWSLLTAVAGVLGGMGHVWSAKAAAAIALIATAGATLSDPLHKVWDDIKGALDDDPQT